MYETFSEKDAEPFGGSHWQFCIDNGASSAQLWAKKKWPSQVRARGHTDPQSPNWCFIVFREVLDRICDFISDTLIAPFDSSCCSSLSLTYICPQAFLSSVGDVATFRNVSALHSWSAYYGNLGHKQPQSSARMGVRASHQVRWDLGSFLDFINGAARQVSSGLPCSLFWEYLHW